MLNLLNRFFKSRFLKILLRIVASLASAIVLISGLLFFMSLGTKAKDDNSPSIKEEKDEEESLPLDED